MTFAPILARELRLRARNQGTYWSRFGVVVVGLTLCLPPLLGFGWFGGTANPGKQLLDSLVATGLLLTCAAALLSADALSSEQREGTLGLLLLTRVRPLDIVLGKLGSTGFAGFCALLAAAPLLVLPSLAGGVTGGEVARKALVLANTLFLALATGLFCSSLAGGEKARATRNTVAFVVVILLVPLSFSAIGVGGATLAPLLGWPSPVTTLSLAADPVYRASPAPYFGSLALQHALGWLLIGGARARLHLAVRQEPQMPDAPAREWAWAGSAFPAARSWHFDNSNPVEWLVRRQRAVPVAVWTGALLTAVYPLLFTVLFRFWTPGVGGSGRVFIQFPSFAVSLISGALFAWAASRFVVQNRQDGGLELLLTTPVGANTIILEQWTALKRIFRLPVLVMLSIPLLQFVSLMVLNSRFGATIALIPTSLFLGMAHTVLYVGALCWTALWFGFKLQRPVAVVAWTVLVVEAVPYLFSTFWFFIFVPFLRAGSALPSAFGFLLWPMTQVVVLVFFVWLIRTRKARLLALFPPAAPRSFNLQRSLAEAAAKVRQARHWTPS